MVFPPSYVLWGTKTGTCRVFVYLLLHGIPSEYRVVSYIVGKVFSRGLQLRWNRENRFSIHGEITETSCAVWTLRGEWTLASCLDLLTVREAAHGYLGRWRRLCKKGGRIIPLEIGVEIWIRPGHDKATSWFAYISPSTLWISVKFGTYGKVFLRKIQRHRLQQVWRRTRWGRRKLLGNEPIGTDKEY